VAILNCIHDRFKSVGQIGKGSFGKVYLLKRLEDKKKFAAKIVSKKKLKSEDLSMFADEIRIMRSLHHRNIIRIEEVHESTNTIYVLMEYIEGGILMNSSRVKIIEEPIRLKIMMEIIETLAYLKKKQVVHRDLKPENILLENQGKIKVIDFGLSVSDKVERKLNPRAGTPGYVPPEVLNIMDDNEEVGYSEGQDLFAGGVIHYCMAFGKHPFNGTDWNDVLSKNIACCPEFPPHPHIAELDLIKSMLEPEPWTRATLSDVQSSLEEMVTPLLQKLQYDPDTKDTFDEEEEADSGLFDIKEQLSKYQNICTKKIQ